MTATFVTHLLEAQMLDNILCVCASVKELSFRMLLLLQHLIVLMYIFSFYRTRFI